MEGEMQTLKTRKRNKNRQKKKKKKKGPGKFSVWKLLNCCYCLSFPQTHIQQKCFAFSWGMYYFNSWHFESSTVLKTSIIYVLHFRKIKKCSFKYIIYRFNISRVSKQRSKQCRLLKILRHLKRSKNIRVI